MREAALKLVARMEQDTRLVFAPQTRDLFRDAKRHYQARMDKAWGLTDCASKLITDLHAIEVVLTDDEQFVQAGFRLAM